MIERILNLVGLDPASDRVKLHDTPAVEGAPLESGHTSDSTSNLREQKWDYRSVVGCLSYLQAMIRPDITFAVQQCARFCNAPNKQHEEAVKRICRYLHKTQHEGLVMKPDLQKGLECYVDADWAGSWTQATSHDPLSAHSRTGYVLLYAGCPIVWASKRQSLIALSTTEAEYIALSMALREVISVVNLLRELKDRGFPVPLPQSKVKCRTFEDNRSCIEIATNHKTRARTKHLAIRLHHFRSYVEDGTISIEYVSTLDQLADIFTKPLSRVPFSKLRNRLMNWGVTPLRGSVGNVKVGQPLTTVRRSAMSS